MPDRTIRAHHPSQRRMSLGRHTPEHLRPDHPIPLSRMGAAIGDEGVAAGQPFSPRGGVCKEGTPRVEVWVYVGSSGSRCTEIAGR